jgi:hypothetical protein
MLCGAKPDWTPHYASTFPHHEKVFFFFTGYLRSTIIQNKPTQKDFILTKAMH